MRRQIGILSLLLLCSLQLIAQQVPDNQKVMVLYENQRFEEAANYLVSFHAEQPENTKLINSIAYSYRMAKDYQHAAEFYTKLYELDSLNTNALASLAWVKQHSGMHHAAMDLYLKIIEIDSTYIDAHTAVASISKRKGDIINAFNHLLWANHLQPRNPSIANDFATICLSLQKLKLADSVLSVALENNPNHVELLYSKAKVADGLKDYPEVIALSTKLIKLGEGFQPVWSLLAKAYINQEDYQATIDTYTKAMEEYETWGEMDLYYMAISCKALKRYEESLDYIEQALKAAISPNTGFYFAQKAGILKDLNKPSAAASSYIRSFQYQEESIDYFNLALLYDHNLQNKKSALKYYKLYLNKKPGSKEKTYIDYAETRIEALN